MDRRRKPTNPFQRWLGPLRRARGRRTTDRVGYVDVYTRKDVALLLAIFLLNVGDAFLTMLWLSRGGREANPVMEFFLDISPAAFIIQKCFVVGFWLLLLLIHKNFRMARLGLYASLVVYATLMLVHFAIIALDIQPPPEATARIRAPYEARPGESTSEYEARPGESTSEYEAQPGESTSEDAALAAALARHRSFEIREAAAPAASE